MTVMERERRGWRVFAVGSSASRMAVKELPVLHKSYISIATFWSTSPAHGPLAADVPVDPDVFEPQASSLIDYVHRRSPLVIRHTSGSKQEQREWQHPNDNGSNAFLHVKVNPLAVRIWSSPLCEYRDIFINIALTFLFHCFFTAGNSQTLSAPPASTCAQNPHDQRPVLNLGYILPKQSRLVTGQT